MKLCPKCQKQFSDDANFCPVDAARLVPLETQSVAADGLTAKFELGERLGGSRTGAVHRAIDKATGQPAAVKIIAPAVIALPGLAQRLERELKQLERVQSGGVARVLASGKRGDDTWVALELLERPQTLGDAIAARGAMPVEAAARLVGVIGEALIEAAQVGVVHRDLAPKNILFVGDDVKLINFSLPVPTSDKVPGVAEFVAPEQYDGKPVDQRSNLYSLGALYYYVLTGHPVQADANGVIKPPSALADVPPPVEAAILRALDRSPTKRFLTVRQFIDEVGRIARGEVDVRSTQPIGRIGKLPAEVVQTLPGAPPSDLLESGTPAGTMIGLGMPPPSSAVVATAPAGAQAGAAGSDAAPSAAPGRSPWAPPTAPAAADAPATGAPAVAPPVAAPLAAPVAAPVVPPPVLAGPILGTGKKSASTSDPKGRFRETMWFKKGELDAEAAQAAADEHARTGKLTTDKADLLPIDERYKDDGTLSRSDKEKYSLRTGATVATAALRDSGGPPGASGKVSEDALIGEMKRGRNKIFAILAVAVVVLVLIVLLIAR
ncbi:MAG TPA: serine/threonine-protein kinase [Kofleriaceae bacterium]|nr:serine/threonine-protein kinase [Kofleriaceae bacterium]